MTFGGGWMIVNGGSVGIGRRAARRRARRRRPPASARRSRPRRRPGRRPSAAPSVVLVVVVVGFGHRHRAPGDIERPARPADERGRGTTCWFGVRGGPLIAAAGLRLPRRRAIGRRPHGSRATFTPVCPRGSHRPALAPWPSRATPLGPRREGAECSTGRASVPGLAAMHRFRGRGSAVHRSDDRCHRAGRAGQGRPDGPPRTAGRTTLHRRAGVATFMDVHCGSSASPAQQFQEAHDRDLADREGRRRALRAGLAGPRVGQGLLPRHGPLEGERSCGSTSAPGTRPPRSTRSRSRCRDEAAVGRPGLGRHVGCPRPARSLRDRGVDRIRGTGSARSRPSRAVHEPGRGRDIRESRGRERMRHPRIAVVRVVLHDDQPAAGPEAPRRPRRRTATGSGDEVEAVRRQHAVERAARQRIPEVAGARLQVPAGEAPRQLAQPAAGVPTVAVESDDPRHPGRADPRGRR